MNLSEWKKAGGSIYELAQRAGVQSNRLYATMNGRGNRLSMKAAVSLAEYEPDLDPYQVWLEGETKSQKRA